MVLDASLLNIQHYKIWIKGNVELFTKGVAPSPTPWYRSYWKGRFRIAFGQLINIYLSKKWKSWCTCLINLTSNISGTFVILKNRITFIILTCMKVRKIFNQVPTLCGPVLTGPKRVGTWLNSNTLILNKTEGKTK